MDSIQMAFNVAHMVQVGGTSCLVFAAQFRSTIVAVLAALSCLVCQCCLIFYGLVA